MAGKKGVVLEKGKGWAIILMANGEYIRIKTTEYLEVGELYQEKGSSKIQYIAAAVLLLTMVMATIDYFSVQAYAQVADLVELGVNRWGRVVSLQATSDDGKKILDLVDVKNDQLEYAVDKIYSNILKNESIGKKIQKPVLSVQTLDKKDSKLEQQMQKKLDSGLQRAIQRKKIKDNESKAMENKMSGEQSSMQNNNSEHKSELGSKNQNKIGNAKKENDKELDQNEKQEIKDNAIKNNTDKKNVTQDEDEDEKEKKSNNKSGNKLESHAKQKLNQGNSSNENTGDKQGEYKN